MIMCVLWIRFLIYDDYMLSLFHNHVKWYLSKVWLWFSAWFSREDEHIARCMSRTWSRNQSNGYRWLGCHSFIFLVPWGDWFFTLFHHICSVHLLELSIDISKWHFIMHFHDSRSFCRALIRRRMLLAFVSHLWRWWSTFSSPNKGFIIFAP